MKVTVLLIFTILLLSINIYSQTTTKYVDKFNPIEYVRDIYQAGGMDQAKVGFKVGLKTTDNNGTPLASGIPLQAGISSIKIKVTLASTKTNTTPRKIDKLVSSNGGSVEQTFSIDVSNSQTDFVDSQFSGTGYKDQLEFQLPKEWSEIAYSVVVTTNTGTTNLFSNGTNQYTSDERTRIRKSEADVARISVNLDIKQPITDNPSSGGKLVIPITSNGLSFDIKVSVSGCTRIDSSEQILSKNKNTISLEHPGMITNEDCIIKIVPDLEALTVSIKSESTCKPDATVRNQCRVPYSSLTPFDIINKAEIETIKIGTTTSDISNNISLTHPTVKLTAYINGEEVKDLISKDLSQASQAWKILFKKDYLKQLEDQTHKLTIKGVSTNGLELVSQIFTIIKDTKPQLDDRPILSFEDNQLKLSFTLKGDYVQDPKPEVTVEYRKLGGIARDGTIGTNCTPKSGKLECYEKFIVKDARPSTIPEKDKAMIPVLITIKATNSAGQEFTLDEIGIDIANVAYQKEQLKTIRDKYRNSRKKDADKDTAKAEIAKLADKSEVDQVVRDTFEDLIDKNSGDNLDKWIKFSVGIGNVLLKGFGVPFTIPSLSN